MKILNILQIIVLVYGLTLLTSCATTRTTTSTTLRPSVNQKIKWVNGEEIVFDSSMKIYGDVTIKSTNTSAQFLLHLVNKSDQPVLIDPALIQCIQNKGEITEKVVNNEPYYTSAGIPSTNENKSNNSEVKTAVAIGLAALLVGGIIYAATRNSDSRSSTSNRDQHHSHTHSHIPSHNYNCRCSSCTTYVSTEDTKTYTSTSTYQAPAPTYLKKHTLFPGEEYSGLMSFDLPNGVKNIEVIVPVNSGQGILRYQLEVVRVTF